VTICAPDWAARNGMAMKMRLLSTVETGTVLVWTMRAAAVMERVWRRKDMRRVMRRVAPIAVYMRPVTMDPNMRERMEIAERAHLRPSVPAGRLAVLKARKMVLPGYRHYPRSVHQVREYTGLHSHEDPPCIVRARIYQASDEAACKQREVGVLDANILREVVMDSISWRQSFYAQQRRRLWVLHGVAYLTCTDYPRLGSFVKCDSTAMHMHS